MKKALLSAVLMLTVLLFACGQTPLPAANDTQSPAAPTKAPTEPSVTEPTAPSVTEPAEASAPPLQTDPLEIPELVLFPENGAYLPYETDEALGVILNEPFDVEPTATVRWMEGEYEHSYIIPRYVGSEVNLYAIVWDEAYSGYRMEETPTYSCTDTADGCVIFSMLERPDVVPLWFLEIIAPNGESGGRVLHSNGETGTPQLETIKRIFETTTSPAPGCYDSAAAALPVG